MALTPPGGGTDADDTTMVVTVMIANMVKLATTLMDQQEAKEET